MSRGRLEAFSDGVIAIIITIMVLELKVPHEVSWHALLPIGPVFLSWFRIGGLKRRLGSEDSEIQI
jgi:uncharacterized membrane protein